MDLPPLTATAYALVYLRASQQPPQRMLAGTGLTEKELMSRDFVDYGCMRRIIRNIESAGAAPGWAARVGAQLHIGSHGPLGFAALSAPTLGAALEVMVEFHAVRVTTLAVELRRRGQRYSLSLRDTSGDEIYGRYILEPVIRIIEALIETIVGYPVGDNVVIAFDYPAPPYADVLEEVYGSRCEFDTGETSISFPASWHSIRSPLYDESSYRANIAKCRQIIAGMSAQGDPVHQVRHILAGHFDRVLSGELRGEGPPSLQAIASQLHTTPRTLIRRLKHRRSSYRELLEEVRRECADTLLQQAGLTVAEVGERLGYGDPANFGRAFRKMTGVTPAAWRRGRR